MGGSWAYKLWHCTPYQTSLLGEGNGPMTYSNLFNGVEAIAYHVPLLRKTSIRALLV